MDIKTGTEIKKLTAFGSFGEIKMIPMARNKYAYTYLENGIENISFEATTEQGAKFFICGKLLAPGEKSDIYPLKAGRNIFSITVISPDGSTKRDTELRIFRAYPSPKWVQVLDHAPWCPRDSAGELVYNNRMWLFGGYIPETVSDVWSSPNGTDWTKHKDVPSKVGVDIPVTFVFNNKIHVIDVAGVLYSTGDGETWDVVTDKAPFLGRRHMGGTVFKGKMWIMGGVKDKTIYNDVWSSENGIDWKLESKHAPWCKRAINNTILVYKDKMWLFGGGVMGASYFPFIAYNDVWCTSDGVNWDRVTSHSPWPPRIWGSTVVYQNRMWIMAGYRSEPESRHFGDVWYSTDGIEWIEFKQHANSWKRSSGDVPVSLPAPVWEDRHEASAMILNDTLYLMAGMIWPLKNDVWKLKINGLSFLSQPVFEGYADCLYEYKAFADFSKSGQKARYKLINPPQWLTIDEKTGYVSGVAEKETIENIIIEAFDDTGEAVRQEYELHIMTLG